MRVGHAFFARQGSVAGLAGILLAACLASPMTADAGDDADPLYREFVQPPASAKPRVWWHWMNGNISKDGITRDLEWMQRVGIGGFHNFDAQLRTPKIVDERVVYMTPPWIDAMNHAVDLAQIGGMEMAIASSPGWSSTGGPWVKPEQAMKKLVWSETEIDGGRPVSTRLPQPPDVAGPFQDVPKPTPQLSKPKPPIHFYRDVRVLAYPVPAAPRLPEPAISISTGEKVDTALLRDGLRTTGVQLKFGSAEAPACVVFDYGRRSPIASLSLSAPIGNDFFHSPLSSPVLESSDDGSRYRRIADVPAGDLQQHTISFPPVSARYFRVCFAQPPPPYTDLLDATAPGANNLGLGAKKVLESFEVNEIQLSSTARVHGAEAKAGFSRVLNYYEIDSPAGLPEHAIPAKQVIDLTDRMQPDGSLSWKAPRGRWRILRFGYSLSGQENHPAPEEATGLEVDKLDRDLVKSYLDTYLGKYENAVGKDRVGRRGISALMVDSIEVGSQTWTVSLPEEFRKRRGYALAPWMPALTGTLVDDAASTDRFLYDYRRTLAEMLAENHYGQIAESARERGLSVYGEALEQGRAVLGDDMDMRRHAQVPMAAMWAFPNEPNTPTAVRYADIRGAASVAHIYGQNLVALESLTSAFAPWAHAPRHLKPMIDMAFALGVNRPVLHTSVHQPVVDKVPGLTLMLFGQHFTRNETWAEQAGAWISYIARSSQLLQQGRFAADVLYFYGEEAPLTALYRWQVTPDTPKGSGFDFANADVLLNRVQVENGDLVTASGMRYRLLYLGGSSERMTLPVLRRIAELVRQGATVVGNKPLDTPSLADDRKAFGRLAEELWSGRAYGKGRVIASRDVDAALAQLGVTPDFEYRKPQPDSDVLFLHRRLDDGELYFLTNRRARSETIEASFRVSGRQPELWRAEDGSRQPLAYRIENGRTIVPLTMHPNDAFFVVFREPATADARTLDAPRSQALARLDGEWEVSFQPGRGGPQAPLKLAAGSWSEHADPALRYFSGTASYRRELKVPKDWLAGGRIVLDLGEVNELAEVLVNGRSLGISWHPPYRVDLTGGLRKGSNRLEIRVTNLWVNRLIGDAQPGASKVTFTSYPPYLPDAPLRASGLIGPVRLERMESDAAAVHP